MTWRKLKERKNCVDRSCSIREKNERKKKERMVKIID